MSRGALLEALAGAVPSGVVSWEHEVVDVDPFTEADLVVGADGIHSAVRRRWWPGSRPRALDTVAFRGVVDGPVHSVSETWGAGGLFGITPRSPTEKNWFTCIRLESEERRTDVAELLRARFGDWHPAVRAIVEGLAPDAVDRRVLQDVPPLRSYVRDRVVLVGDAAHVMAPNLGRGACESLIDAVILARAVADGDVVAGLRRYDAQRRPRTRRIVGAARMLNRVATMSRGFAVRNAAVGLLARLA